MPRADRPSESAGPPNRRERPESVRPLAIVRGTGHVGAVGDFDAIRGIRPEPKNPSCYLDAEMSRPTILFADPNPTQHKMVDMLFTIDGFEVETVETGRAALEFLKKNTPELAILAMDLDDLDGSAICSRMKSVSRLSNTPVILVAPSTRDLGIPDRVRAIARDVRADLLLQRPLGDKNLRERAKRLIEGERPYQTQSGTQRPVHTTQILEQTIEQMERGQMVVDNDEPRSLQRRVQALQEENRALRKRVSELESQLSHATANSDS